MAKYLRLLISIGVLLGLVMLARSKTAWAANPTTGTDRSSLAQTETSFSQGEEHGCIRGRDKHKDKCKDGDKDKGKDKCKKAGCGTVKPPHKHKEVCNPGSHSVGGVAILNVRSIWWYRCLKADARSPYPALDRVPDGSTILSDIIVLELPPGAEVEICFAVPPNKQANIYSSTQGSFEALKTTVNHGIACADGTKSGDYALAGR